MNPELRSRLTNWKFASAVRHLDGEGENVSGLVHALSEVFGDIGCFSAGKLSVIIETALRDIGIE